MQNKGLLLLSVSLLGLATVASAGAGDDEVVGPGPVPVDVFHPDREREVTPRYGGRVIVHLSAMPENICRPIENSAVTRRMLYELHEDLIKQDWEWHDYRPRAARSYTMEDLVVLREEVREIYQATSGLIDARIKREGELEEGQEQHRLVRAFYGKVEEGEESYLVTPVSKGNPLPAPLEVPASAVASVERGMVFTFELRDDILWHPSLIFEREHPAAFERLKGHKLDARDVLFSWQISSNPNVDCDETRFQYQKVTAGEIVDEHTVRFFYEAQYAFATGVFESLTLLPTHVYDLSDPDNPEHREHFTAEEQGQFINENPHNRLWVGIGPYRVTQWTQQYVQAERFTDDAGKSLYFDRDNAGYVDTIRWRYIDDDETSMNALLNGELDFFERIKSTDYFGQRTQDPEFLKNYYKGYKYLGTYGYTGWNLYRPQLKDVAVRRAIAMAFDFDSYLQSLYRGLARQVTGPFPYSSEAYNHSVEPLPYDVDAAIDLLEEAEWYDRNGNGIRDKDGVELEIDFMMPSGNRASKSLGEKLQESLSELEIKVDIVQLEWATLLDRVKAREFDAINLAWVPSLESDPEQLWHSKWGEYEVRSSNHSGVMDPKIDAFIARGQRELDRKQRMAIWREMHRYVYDLQPYLFGFNVPHKFGMTQRIRGFQSVAIDPGYVIRRWYFWNPEEPGTRTTLDR